MLRHLRRRARLLTSDAVSRRLQMQVQAPTREPSPASVPGSRTLLGHLLSLVPIKS